jgi:hypothetical protein
MMTSIFLVDFDFERIRIQVPLRNPFHAFKPMLRSLHRSIPAPRSANIDNPLDASVRVPGVIA